MREDFKILVQKPLGREYYALYFSLRTTCFGLSLFFWQLFDRVGAPQNAQYCLGFRGETIVEKVARAAKINFRDSQRNTILAKNKIIKAHTINNPPKILRLKYADKSK